MQDSIIIDILKVALTLRKCKLKYEKLGKVQDQCDRLKLYFDCSLVQVIFLIIIYEKNSKGFCPTMEDFSSYLNCNPIELMPHKKAFQKLLDRGLINRKEDRLIFFRSNDRLRFEINKSVMESIDENKPIQIESSNKEMCPMSIILHLCEMIDERENEEGSTLVLWEHIKSYLESKSEVEVCKHILNVSPEPNDVMVLIVLMARNIEFGNNQDVERVTQTIIESSISRRRYIRSLEKNETILQKKNWIKQTTESFIQDSELYLTNKAVEYFEPLGVELKLNKKTKEVALIKPESISRKKLYFNATEVNTLNNLQASLKVRKHNQIIKSLKAEGMRTGICTLYYGPPGTGKTESVYQIAKETGRSVWKVDMSELKSMWYGQSQKLVKGIFNDYIIICKEESRTPILLLNEADAILGIRNANASSTTGKVDNAIQNIFLDCLEDFEGILFATTNLETSLDKAFERRFLFKIKFSRPDTAVQFNIWKSNLKSLKKKEINYIIERFSFSGGEIENIIRKIKIDNILKGSSLQFDRLVEICESESLVTRQDVSLGFRAYS
ncbi:ATP-binding protein [Croceibacter atlanticus]|uniref:ATP-binding protein n=1 Tax=Croceibacter atlanticus TaxID=313588 RepID=UPI0030D8111D|tara:strand:+ start:53681 stop:55345 length:1665 start_codon:yes stop_codon:yes gene_type:complete